MYIALGVYPMLSQLDKAIVLGSTVELCDDVLCLEKDVKAVLVYKVFVEGDKPLAEESNICFRDLWLGYFLS